MEEALTALLANVAGGRRYWVRAPQTEKPPYIVLNRVSGRRDYTAQKASGYVTSRVQVDCYAATYGDAKALARQVERALSGRRAGAVQGIFLDSERDLPAADAGDVNHLFRISLDFMIHHTLTGGLHG